MSEKPTTLLERGKSINCVLQFLERSAILFLDLIIYTIFFSLFLELIEHKSYHLGSARRVSRFKFKVKEAISFNFVNAITFNIPLLFLQSLFLHIFFKFSLNFRGNLHSGQKAALIRLNSANSILTKISNLPDEIN